LALNHSPEPFSNLLVSVGEDAFVLGGLYLLVEHPWVLAAITLILLTLFAWLAPRIYRSVRAEWATAGALLRSWFGMARPPELTTGQRQWLRDNALDAAVCFSVIATPDIKGLHNAVGTLCMTPAEAVFFTRRWGRSVARRLGPLAGVDARAGLLLDTLVVTTGDGMRRRFDLLPGQLQDAREAAGRQPSSSPAA
jgi:hypothetical protein